MADNNAFDRVDEILASICLPPLSFGPQPVDERDWWLKQLGKPIEWTEPEPALH